ncbi:MAG: hypothetical protein ACK4HF_18305 [Paracoccaceae bacterium]
MFSRTDLTTLIEATPDVAVSLYLPTQTHGRETRQNPIMLKNLLRQAADALAERSMVEREIESFLAPAAQLVEDYDFWQHQDAGLAIFLSDAGIQIHKLPILVPELAVIGPGHHIAPLLPLQEQDAVCVILTMTAETAEVRLATRFSLTAIEVADLPRSIESLDEAPDYEGSLQSHGFGRPNTGGQSMPKTQVYGDSPEEWRKGRLVEFARRAGSALATHLARDPKPVVVVADAAVGGHVRNDVALAPLVVEFVEVNPAILDEAGLLAAASEVMQSLHDKAVNTALERFGILFGRGDATACTDPARIAVAARDGRVDQLFIARDAVLRGTLDSETGAALVAGGGKTGTVDLLDKVAQMALGNGGGVWMVAQDSLQEGTAMAAILRY